MARLLSKDKPDQLQSVKQSDGLPRFDPQNLVRHSADAHWILIDDNEEQTGRCSLWWTNTPPYEEHRVGLIGHYAVTDAAAGREILAHSCEQLAGNGCTLVIAPMDGNSWNQYRLVTKRGNEPPFFMEPDNPDDWPDHFVDQGFRPLAHYSSSICSDLSKSDPRVRQSAERIAELGIVIRPLDMQRIEEELLSIFEVSLKLFSDNLLYTPINESDFLAQYLPIQAHVQPELVLMAENQDSLVGFLFAIPDILQAQRGDAIDTFIVKTLGILPKFRRMGLGGLMWARLQKEARALGYRRSIHALMQEGNEAGMISTHFARSMRRYTLFSKPIQL